jgi:hypothetical protein
MKRVYTLIFFIFLTSSIYSQPQMKWFNPSPDGISLKSIWFVDAGHAWVVGDFGKILFWNGHNWVSQDSKTSEKLQSVYFTDAYHGWAVGSNGCIMRYENNAWTDQSINAKVNLSCVVIPGTGDGWICGDTILRLIDNVWTVLPGQDTLNFTSLSFTSKNDGWAVNNSRSVFHFNGVSWSVNPASNTGGFFYNLSFSDPDHGIISSMEMDGFVIYNFNHGSLLPAMPATNIQSVFMIDSTNGYAVGFGGWFYMGDGRGYIYKYENSLWSIDTIVETPLLSIHGNGNIVWATGVCGNIYLKQNGKWMLINSYTDQTFNSMSFPDSLHGWMASENGYIFKYNHGIFEKDTVFSNLRIYDLHFTDSLTGYAIAGENVNDSTFQFLEFKNNKWSVTEEFSLWTPFSFSVVDPNHIWATTIKDILFYDGTTWSIVYTGLPYAVYFEDIVFISPSLGYAVGTNSFHDSFIMKFDGSNWTTLRDDLPPFMVAIGAFDGQYCWTTSYYGHIWRINVNTNEVIEEMPQQNSFFEFPSIQMTANTNGYLSNPNGIMEYDGTVWTRLSSLPTITPMSFDFTHENYKWIGGYYGILLSTYAQSSLAVSYQPQRGNGIHAFPNPVTENTVIEYELERPAKVKVEIFDAWGRLIISTDEGVKTKGLNAYRLRQPLPSAGIYLCRISIGNKVQIVKLIKK